MYSSFPNITWGNFQNINKMKKFRVDLIFSVLYSMTKYFLYLDSSKVSSFICLAIPFVFWCIVNSVPIAADLPLNSAYTVHFFAIDWDFLGWWGRWDGMEEWVLTLCLSQNLSDFLSHFGFFPQF